MYPRSGGCLLTDKESRKHKQWKELSDFLNRWYSEPDLEALLVMYAAYTSHFYLRDKPIWMFLTGPSGAGKTEIAFRSLSYLDHVHTVSELTPNTFLSGLGPEYGLLPMLTRISNGNGVLTFPDLSVLIEKRHELLAEIISQMRRVADGQFEKFTGASEESLGWKGKVTAIAACTPELERKWSIFRSLGERFMSLNWNVGDVDKIMNLATKHVTKEEYIDNEFRKYTTAFVNREDFSSVGVESLVETMKKFQPLAKLIALVRTPVARETLGSKRSVVAVGTVESPTRIMKALANLARGSATLFGRKECIEADFSLSRRLAIDSIPNTKFKILKALMRSEDREIVLKDVVKKTGIPRTSAKRAIEDFQFLELVKFYKDEDNNILLRPTAELCSLWEGSGF